jgi:hypothetical protein
MSINVKVMNVLNPPWIPCAHALDDAWTKQAITFNFNFTRYTVKILHDIIRDKRTTTESVKPETIMKVDVAYLKIPPLHFPREKFQVTCQVYGLK